MWILNTKRQQVPKAASKNEATPVPCVGQNETVFCPKLKSLTCGALEEKKISYEGDIWILSLLLLLLLFLPTFSIFTLSSAAKFKFETILSNSLVLNSLGEGEAYDFLSRYILKGLKGPTTSSRNFNKHIEIASWLILGISLLPVHFIERSCGQEI